MMVQRAGVCGKSITQIVVFIVVVVVAIASLRLSFASLPFVGTRLPSFPFLWTLGPVDSPSPSFHHTPPPLSLLVQSCGNQNSSNRPSLLISSLRNKKM